MSADEAKRFAEALEALREDMRDAGGFETWLATRMSGWIAPLPRCSARSVARVLARR